MWLWRGSRLQPGVQCAPVRRGGELMSIIISVTRLVTCCSHKHHCSVWASNWCRRWWFWASYWCRCWWCSHRFQFGLKAARSEFLQRGICCEASGLCQEIRAPYNTLVLAVAGSVLTERLLCNFLADSILVVNSLTLTKLVLTATFSLLVNKYTRISSHLGLKLALYEIFFQYAILCCLSKKPIKSYWGRKSSRSPWVARYTPTSCWPPSLQSYVRSRWRRVLQWWLSVYFL